MELKQHYNYVALFGDGRLKIGRTANPSRRRKEYKGLYAFEAGDPVDPIVARFTEINIRRVFEGRTVPGTFEWFSNENKSSACAIVEMTARMQKQLVGALA